MRLRRHGDDRVEGTRDEVRELELDDRALPHPRRSDRGADEALLRDGRVDHAVRSELLVQAGGDPERAAEDADVLAEDEDALVVAHRVLQRSADRVEIGDLSRRSGAGLSTRCLEMPYGHGGQPIR